MLSALRRLLSYLKIKIIEITETEIEITETEKEKLDRLFDEIFRHSAASKVFKKNDETENYLEGWVLRSSVGNFLIVQKGIEFCYGRCSYNLNEFKAVGGLSDAFHYNPQVVPLYFQILWTLIEELKKTPSEILRKYQIIIVSNGRGQLGADGTVYIKERNMFQAVR